MGYTSTEYNQLIDKLIHAVDMLFDAEVNYTQYSKQFRSALRDCLNHLQKYTVDHDVAYNDFFSKLSIEYAVFLFDMFAFCFSEVDSSNQNKLPSWAFDFSGLTTKWDEKLDSKRKEEYLNEYLSTLLQQTDVILSQWQKSHAFNETTKQKFTSLFNEFKQVITDFQTQKRSLDKSWFIEMQKTNVFNKYVCFLSTISG